MAQGAHETFTINRCETCDRTLGSVGAIRHWQTGASGDYVPACCECSHDDRECWYEADPEPEPGPGRRLWKILASIGLIIVAAAFWLFGIAVVALVLIGLPFLIGVAAGGGGSRAE